MSQQELKLQAAINALSRYYGIQPIERYIERAISNTQRDRTIASITNGATTGTGIIVDATNSEQAAEQRRLAIANQTPALAAAARTETPLDSLCSELIKDIIDTSTGVYLTNDLIRILNDQLGVGEEGLEDRKRKLFNLFEIYYGNSSQDIGYYQPMSLLGDRYRSIVGSTDGMGMIPENSTPRINQDIDNPDKTKPSIAIYVSKHPRISLNLKNANACTIFFNGMPSLELSRAVPYIDVKMFLPRPSISGDNKLFATSLVKFLGGAKEVTKGTPEYNMAKANEIQGTLVSNNRTIDTYNISGMEMFLSPQTLVNGDETDTPSLRSNPVLDKFRPFLSLQSLSIDIVPSHGEMSTKTGKLKLILHDRSRMNDIADFLKADLYSSQEIEIEYGWSHPDGNLNNSDNPYADLINGLRVKEKFSVVSSNFSFLENGSGVSIELSLLTRGAANMITQGIFNYSDDTQRVSNRLSEFQRTISEIRTRMFPTQEGEQRTREIRAPRFLDLAADASPLLSLGRDSQRELDAFRAQLRNSHTPDASRLNEILGNLFATATNAPRRRVAGRALTEDLFTDRPGSTAAQQLEAAKGRVTEAGATAEANLTRDRPTATVAEKAAARAAREAAATRTEINISQRGRQIQRGNETREAEYQHNVEGSVINDLRLSIISQVQQQLTNISQIPSLIGTNDPFYNPAGDNQTGRTVLPSSLGGQQVARNRQGISSIGTRALVEDNARRQEINAQGRNVRVETAEEARQRAEALAASERRISPNDGYTLSSFCSLATLLLNFIGKPLASTNNFDEIQFVYYPFNEKAGFASKITTANFLIDLRLFEELLIRNRIENVSGATGMTLIQFMRFLQTSFFDDQSSHSYGLWDANGALMRRSIDEATGREITEPADSLPQFQSRVNAILQNVTPGGNFQLPQIELLIETLPAKYINDQLQQVIESSGDKTVLRIHVFDASATAYSTEASILEALREDQLGILNNVLPGPVHDDIHSGGTGDNRIQSFRDGVQAAIDFGAIQIQTPEGVTSLAPQAQAVREQIMSNSSNIRIFGGSRTIKEYLMKTAPHIIYGALGSTVLNANLSSQSDATMQTLGILAAPQQNSLLPSGELPGGLPMQIIPNELSITTMGNPLISYMQNFFIDFQTGTTLDNIYYVTGLTHTIESGKFTSQITFAANDAYQRYNNLNSRISNMITILNDYRSRQQSDGQPVAPAVPST